MEEYAKDALELLEECLKNEIPVAAANLKKGMDLTGATRIFESRVRSEMRHELFSKVKSERLVDPGYRMEFYPGMGIYRRRPRELTESAVPGRLLNADALIPDLGERLSAAMLAASRKAMEERIVETAARAASGPEGE